MLRTGPTQHLYAKEKKIDLNQDAAFNDNLQVF
jgi:hypothetical protein